MNVFVIFCYSLVMHLNMNLILYCMCCCVSYSILHVNKLLYATDCIRRDGYNVLCMQIFNVIYVLVSYVISILWENSCLFILICEKTKSTGGRRENKTIATSAYCFYLFDALSNLLIYFSHGNTRYHKKDLLYISIRLKRLWKQNNIIHNAAAALFICSTQVFSCWFLLSCCCCCTRGKKAQRIQYQDHTDITLMSGAFNMIGWLFWNMAI